jgi:hypothetical protein
VPAEREQKHAFIECRYLVLRIGVEDEELTCHEVHLAFLQAHAEETGERLE